MNDREDNRTEALLAEMLEKIDQQICAGDKAKDSTVLEDGEATDPSLDDRVLRAASVLRLLEELRPGSGGSASAGSRSDSGATPTIFGDDALPKNVGRFEIRGKLGQGGFGVVFHAFDPDLKRQVALKIPRPEILISKDLQQRFLKEGQAAASLNHANVVPVFEAGRTGAVYYLASSLCRGDTLAHWTREQSEDIPEDIVATWIRQLAEAIQHAHSRGILHRDLKPSNVMLVMPDDSKPDQSLTAADPHTLIPMVTDFGLAKNLEAGGDDTHTSAVMGTPNYMSPEQARGDQSSIDRRSDIYSLGAIMYFMLAGRPPFERDTAVAILQAVQMDPPPSLQRARPGMSRDLQAICEKCLEKDPQNRYATASELAEDLQRWLNGEPVRAHPVSATQRFVKWCKRNPTLAMLSGTTAALLLIALAAVTAGWFVTSQSLDRERIARTDAEVAREDAEKRYRDAWNAVDEYFTIVAEDRLLNTPGMKPLRILLLQAAVTYFDRFLADRRDDDDLRREVAKAHFRIGRVQRDVGEYNKAMESFLASLEVLEELANEPEVTSQVYLDLATVHSFAAMTEFRRKNLQSAQRHIDQGIASSEILPEDDPLIGKAEMIRSDLFNTRGIALREAGKPQEAVASYEAALTLTDHWLNQEPDNVEFRKQRIGQLGNLANVTRQLGGPREAIEFFNEIVQECRDLLEDDADAIDVQDLLASSLGNLCLVQFQAGEYLPAQGSCKESEEMFDTLSRQHPQVMEYKRGLAGALTRKGAILDQLRDLPSAKLASQASVEIYEGLVEDYPDVPDLVQELVDARMNLAVQVAKLGDSRAALAAFVGAYDGMEKLIEVEPEVARHKVNMGFLCLNIGSANGNLKNYEEAVKYYDRSIEYLRPAWEGTPTNLQLQNALAGAYASRANYHERLDQWELALRDRREALNICQDNQKAYCKFGVALTLARSGEIDEPSQILAEIPPESDGDEMRMVVNRGQLHALIARNLEHQDDAADHEDAIAMHKQTAMEQLEIARDNNWFDRPSTTEMLTEEHRFEALHDLPEFIQFRDEVMAKFKN